MARTSLLIQEIILKQHNQPDGQSYWISKTLQRPIEVYSVLDTGI